MLGRRNMEIRNEFKLPKPFKIANFAEGSNSTASATVMTGGSTPPKSEQQGEKNKKSTSTKGYHDGKARQPPTGPISFHTHAANPTLNWERDIGWLKEQCSPEMEVWVKGLATAEDAHLAVRHGVDGIVVSNHGGRQLNGALATIDALPEIVDAVKGKIPVHIGAGGGFRLDRAARAVGSGVQGAGRGGVVLEAAER